MNKLSLQTIPNSNTIDSLEEKKNSKATTTAGCGKPI